MAKPSWRDKQVKLIERSQDRCVNTARDATDQVLADAVEEIWKNYQLTGHWLQPSLNELFSVSARFYRQVLEEAFAHAEAAKRDDKRPLKPKRLAKKPGPKGMPRTMRNLEEVFRDRRYWPKIMRRSNKVTERLRKSYLGKLKKVFDKLIPRVVAGEISPDEAKTELQESWKTSRSRVETIFRTETTNYFSSAQVAFFSSDDEIIGFLFDSVKDRSRTDICRSRHGLVYRPGSKELTENTPALHYNCRSHLIPLVNIEENRRMLADPSRDPKKRKVAPLPDGWRR